MAKIAKVNFSIKINTYTSFLYFFAYCPEVDLFLYVFFDYEALGYLPGLLIGSFFGWFNLKYMLIETLKRWLYTGWGFSFKREGLKCGEMQYIHRLLKWIIITGAWINILITLFIRNITVSESNLYSITWHSP